MPDTQFNTQVRNEHRHIAETRFGMHHGQFFGEYMFKNLHWVLDGNVIGFGDLRQVDISALLNNLKPGEVFEGFNEHHGSQFQQTDHAMVKITDGVISFPVRDAR